MEPIYVPKKKVHIYNLFYWSKPEKNRILHARSNAAGLT